MPPPGEVLTAWDPGRDSTGIGTYLGLPGWSPSSHWEISYSILHVIRLGPDYSFFNASSRKNAPIEIELAPEAYVNSFLMENHHIHTKFSPEWLK